MDKKPLISKWLAVGIILLFVGVTIAPAFNFNTVKASQEKNLVEVTTQACGITGYGDTTVKFTRQQYNDLEQYLVEFRTRLNETSTREEAVPIFKEAVVKLDKYGLLPRGMSIDQAQRLVMYSALCSFKWTGGKKTNVASLSENHTNTLCLIAGKTDYTVFETIGSSFIQVIAIMFGLKFWIPAMFFIDIWFMLSYGCLMSPVGLINRINLGCYEYGLYEPYHVSSGWIITAGVQGIKKSEGYMIGSLPLQGTMYPQSIYHTYVRYPAVVGFIGIKIRTSQYPDLMGSEFFYLGSALNVGINPEPPS